MERFNLMNYIRITLLPLHYTVCFKREKKEGHVSTPNSTSSVLLLADIPHNGKSLNPVERLLADKRPVLI